MALVLHELATNAAKAAQVGTAEDPLVRAERLLRRLLGLHEPFEYLDEVGAIKCLLNSGVPMAPSMRPAVA
jgi:hypothetical protein